MSVCNGHCSSLCMRWIWSITLVTFNTLFQNMQFFCFVRWVHVGIAFRFLGFVIIYGLFGEGLTLKFCKYYCRVCCIWLHMQFSLRDHCINSLHCCFYFWMCIQHGWLSWMKYFTSKIMYFILDYFYVFLFLSLDIVCIINNISLITF